MATPTPITPTITEAELETASTPGCMADVLALRPGDVVIYHFHPDGYVHDGFLRRLDRRVDEWRCVTRDQAPITCARIVR